MHQHATALYLDGNKFLPVEDCASRVLNEGAHLAECTSLDCGSDDKPGARNACIHVACVCMCVRAHMYVCTSVLCLCICMSDCACVSCAQRETTQFRGERLETLISITALCSTEDVFAQPHLSCGRHTNQMCRV